MNIFERAIALFLHTFTKKVKNCIVTFLKVSGSKKLFLYILELVMDIQQSFKLLGLPFLKLSHCLPVHIFAFNLFHLEHFLI